MCENDSAMRLGLVNTLFTIINFDPADQPDTILARYFLEHYDSIASMNIYDVADECFVSRSSIRRFSQRIGFDNFKELKNAFKVFDYQYNYFTSLCGRDDFREYMTRELEKMIADSGRLITDEKLDEIAGRIHDSSDVLLMSSYNGVMCLSEFQRPLVLSGKLINIMTDTSYDRKRLEEMDEDGFILASSAMGHFARTVGPDLEGCRAYKVLLTTSYDESIKAPFDDVIYLSSGDYTNLKSVYSKYGISLFFDLLYSTYMRRYGMLSK